MILGDPGGKGREEREGGGREEDRGRSIAERSPSGTPRRVRLELALHRGPGPAIPFPISRLTPRDHSSDYLTAEAGVSSTLSSRLLVRSFEPLSQKSDLAGLFTPLAQMLGARLRREKCLKNRLIIAVDVQLSTNLPNDLEAIWTSEEWDERCDEHHHSDEHDEAHE